MSELKAKSTKQTEPETPPPGDPYEMMYRQYIWLIRRLYIVEQKMASLEKTWTEILNVSKNSALPPLEFNPWEQPKAPVAKTTEEPEPVIPRKSTPIWEQTEQDLKQEAIKPKKKSSKGILFFIISIGLLLIIIITGYFLHSKGWSCALPIPGLK